MAMTAAERKELLKKLDGDWYYLDRHIKDDQEREQFVWDVAKEGLVEDIYFCSTLSNYYEPSRTEAALDYIVRLQPHMKEHEYRGVRGWDSSIEWLLQRIAELDPDGLKKYEGLPGPASDFSQLFLAYNGEGDDMTPSARRRLAQAWASTSWDEQWYSVRESVPEDDWAELVIDAITAPDVAQVEWDRIREFIPLANVSQRLSILSKDRSQHQRAHALEALGEATADELDTIHAALDATKSDEYDYYRDERRRALGCVLVTRHAALAIPIPDSVLDAFREELSQYANTDLDVTLAATRSLAACDEKLAEKTICEALSAESYGLPRAVAVMGAVQTSTVLDAALDKISKMTEDNDVAVAGLAGFGKMAVEPLIERLGAPKLAAGLATLYVRALDALGDPAAAETLVQQTGASSKAVRVAAAKALENLGSAALPALEAGVKANKKAVRETCESLVEAAKMAGDNPVKELEKRLARLDDPALEQVFSDFATQSSYSSNDYEKVTPFAEKHGSLVLLRARDYYLEMPGDWQRGEVWRGTLEFFKKDPDVAWIAVDTFSKLPKGMYSYYVDNQTRLLRDIAGRAPKKTGEAIVHYLKGSPPEYRADLLTILTETAPKTELDVYLKAMEDSSKVVRELGVEGVSQYGAEALDAVVSLLSSKKKDVRLAAATALTRISAGPALEAIREALGSEKTAEVRTILEQAVEAAGGSAFEFPGDDGATVTDEDIDTFLAGLNQAKLPAFIDLDKLPALRFADSGKELSKDALAAFVTRLMKEDPDNEDAVARRVRPYLDDASAGELSVAIKDAWASSGGNSKDKWAIYQQGVLASEERLDEVGPRLDEMAAFGQHHLAGWYLDVMHRHGSLGGRSWVAYWSKAAERDSVSSKATALVERAAEAAGLDAEAYTATLNTYIADDVADRNVPRLGLEKPIVVDYGARTFEARLDQNHNLVIRDVADNKEYKSLPAARKDETLDQAAKERVSATKKELRRIVKDVAARLEDGMISGRPWKVDAFRKLFFGHPIMTPFAGRVVFRADDGTLFRVSEGDFLNADYDVVELAPDQTVRIAHPLEMTAAEIQDWSEHFADAEIMQPFEQLGRPTFTKDDDPFFKGEKLGTTTRGAVAGRLRRLGWRRGWAEDAGLVYTASRLLAGRGVRAWLEHGGFYVGDPSWEADEEIEVTHVWFQDLQGKELKLKNVDPLAYSEVRLEVTKLLE